MPGAILTFLGVCAIVAIYMSIVHSFLRRAEEPEDRLREREEQSTRRKAHRRKLRLRLRWAQ
jgi:hypothetical protein